MAFSKRLTLLDTGMGALMATLGLHLLKVAFGLYVLAFPSYQAITVSWLPCL